MTVAEILPPDWLSVFSRDHPRIAIGIDPATTTKKKSNPTGIVVMQQVGLMHFQRLVIRLKTGDGDVIEQLLKTILLGLRTVGLSCRRICILATNERFFAVALRKKLVRLAPVELVIESEAITYLGEEMKVKAYLGNLVVNTIDDGYLPMPNVDWLKRDYRSIIKDRGTFDAEILADGGHGDCFAGAGAALHGLKSAGGPAEAAGVQVGTYRANSATPSRKLLNPYAAKFGRNRGGRLAT